jgi:hypothetical protein
MRGWETVAANRLGVVLPQQSASGSDPEFQGVHVRVVLGPIVQAKLPKTVHRSAALPTRYSVRLVLGTAILRLDLNTKSLNFICATLR